MEYRRIQKLLSSEYCDFSDRVIIESPFAETTRDGRGLRQVSLGLTPTRLVVAADILKNNSEFTCPPDLDPSIETFELVSVYPLDFVALSIFCRRKRRTIKARLIDGRAKYYELGGMKCRNVLWALWCQSVREIVAKRQEGSSLSETTAASSSSASTLYLLSSGREAANRGKSMKIPRRYQVWAHYGGAGDGQPWLRKDIYLGPSYDELSHGFYAPVPIKFTGTSLEDLNDELKDLTPKSLACRKTCGSWPCSKSPKTAEKEFRAGALCDVLFMRENRRNRMQRHHSRSSRDYSRFDTIPDASQTVLLPGIERRTTSDTSGVSPPGRSFPRQKRKSGSPKKHALAPKLSRFGFGIGENCGSGLYLEPWSGDRDHFTRKNRTSRTDIYTLVESGVQVWENYNVRKGKDQKGNGERKNCGYILKKRKNESKGSNDSERPDKNDSLKNSFGGRKEEKLRHPRRYGLATAAHFLHALGPWSVQPGERESVQRRRASSAVCIRRQPLEPELRLPVSKRQLAASVSLSSLDPGKSGTISSSTRGRVVLFWTPEYWYRPRAAAAAYREVRRHLDSLQEFRTSRNEKKCFLFSRRKRSCGGANNGLFGSRTSVVDERTNRRVEKTSSTILSRFFSSRETKKRDDARESGTSQLKRLLRMDLRITAWDLDSTTIARQLTLIDRELFQRIPCSEIEKLISQKSSRNTPNIGAWIAFAHRVSCLIASEILATKKLDMRTRILSRFINAADKCYVIGNFQSCRSILAGLQSPPIYRLRSTWSYLRIHHSTRYQTMERLCKIYKSTTSRSYRRAWRRCEKRPPLLPYVDDLLARILDEDDNLEKFYLDFSSWTSRPCRLACSDPTGNPRVPSILGNVGSKLTTNGPTVKKLRSVNSSSEKMEKESSGRRRIGGRIFFAIPRVGSSRIASKPEVDDSREKFLEKKYFSKWRRIVLASRMMAEREAKIMAMEPRRRKATRISTWLCECQRHSQGYNFSGHSLAWEFLLKARYREDRENFFISLKLEPPCG